jgi:hypothetical protein
LNIKKALDKTEIEIYRAELRLSGNRRSIPEVLFCDYFTLSFGCLLFGMDNLISAHWMFFETDQPRRICSFLFAIKAHRMR